MVWNIKSLLWGGKTLPGPHPFLTYPIWLSRVFLFFCCCFFILSPSPKLGHSLEFFRMLACDRNQHVFLNVGMGSNLWRWTHISERPRTELDSSPQEKMDLESGKQLELSSIFSLYFTLSFRVLALSVNQFALLPTWLHVATPQTPDAC